MVAMGRVTVGQLVAGRYRVVQPLAAGGLGGVWLAADETTGEPVAIKRCGLPAGLTPDEQDLFRVWTVREAREFALVQHPNVIRTRDVLADDDAPWIVMDYVPSRSLQRVIDQSGALPPARVAGIGLAVLEGLLAIRRAGLLHLDVKPGNVLIADDGRVVLTDFGPAVTVEGVRALAASGIILGSPKYLAPERLTGGVASPESDLWSLGATLYHAVEGRPPYVRPTTVDLLLALGEGPPDPMTRAGPLAPIIESLLRRDPGHRPAPDRVADELRALVSRPIPAESGARPGRRRRLAAHTGHRRWVAALLGAAAVAGSVVVVVARPGETGTAQPSPVAAAPAVAPAGYVWFEQPPLYRLAVPAAWQLTVDGKKGVLATGPSGRPALRVTVGPAPADPVAALISQERATGLPGYRRVKIERLPESRDAIWEYTWEDQKDGPMHGQQRVFVGGPVSFTVDWRAPRDAWATHLTELTTVVGSFTASPAG